MRESIRTRKKNCDAEHIDGERNTAPTRSTDMELDERGSHFDTRAISQPPGVMSMAGDAVSDGGIVISAIVSRVGFSSVRRRSWLAKNFTSSYFPLRMPDDPKAPNAESEREQSPWALAGLGAQFFGAIIVFVYAGSWLDRRFDSSPLFLLGGLFLGGGGTFYLSYRRLTAAQRRSEKRR